MLDQVGIDSALLEVERARITSTRFRALSEYLSRELQDENCGMLAQRSKIGTFAMMCHACLSCPTLSDFLQRGIEFNALVLDCVEFKLYRDKTSARYVINAQPNSTDSEEIIIMVLLGIVHRLSSWAISQTVALDSVDINRPRPSYAHEYSFLFKAPINFDAGENCIRFADRYLDMPIVQTERELADFLAGPSVYLMNSTNTDNSLVSKIRAMIENDVNKNFPEFGVVATMLHMTTATLRRRLRAEGSSYQQLKDGIRRDTAIYHLGRGKLTMEQVAESVGFSEPTSFFRAFKRWTGVTPRAYTASANEHI